MAGLFVEKVFAKLTASSQALPQLSVFEREIRKTKFTIFQSPIVDLGYFEWNAALPPRYRCITNQCAEEFTTHLVKDSPIVKPPELLAVDLLNRHLPLPYALKSDAGSFMSKYPYDVPHLASLVVAQRRRGNLDGIDFVLGGSSLEVLATGSTNEKTHVVYRVPFTNILVFEKCEVYRYRPMNVGFQLERYVTGKPMNAIAEKRISLVEHLQTMKVGRQYNVLFSAEVDAQQGDILCEVKAGPPQSSGFLFQMISSGSAKCCNGSGTAHAQSLLQLDKVILHDLSDLCQQLLRTGEEEIFEETILRNLKSLKEQMADIPAGKVKKVMFDEAKKICLEPCRIKVLPRDSVVKRILTT